MNIDLKPPDRFTIYGIVEDIPTALSIFESIHFSSGDPAKTRPLTADRFVSGMPPTGKATFLVYCRKCHSRRTQNIGQAMSSDYVRQKGEKWIADWLSHRPIFDRDTVNGIPCGGRAQLKPAQI